jgi:hypothetical protein
MQRPIMTCPICEGAETPAPCSFCNGDGSLYDPRGVHGKGKAGVTYQVSLNYEEAPSHPIHRGISNTVLRSIDDLGWKIAKLSHRRVLVAIVSVVTVEPSASDGVLGLCDDEIRDVILGFGFQMSDSTVRHRRADLVRWGLIRGCGSTKNDQGNAAQSWLPTSGGLKQGHAWSDEVLL